jgi:hypothetical protein
MTDLAASLSRTITIAKGDLLEVALLSLGGLLLSIAARISIVSPGSGIPVLSMPITTEIARYP